jgi:hypothetical protein
MFLSFKRFVQKVIRHEKLLISVLDLYKLGTLSKWSLYDCIRKSIYLGYLDLKTIGRKNIPINISGYEFI